MTFERNKHHYIWQLTWRPLTKFWTEKSW